MKEFEKSSKVDDMIYGTISKLKTLIDSNSIIGEPVVTQDKTVIIPISKITVGFLVGGGEYSDMSTRRVASHYPMAGGSGGGMSLTPVGFLVQDSSGFKYIDVENKSAYQTVLKLFNRIIDFIGDKNVNKNKD